MSKNEQDSNPAQEEVRMLLGAVGVIRKEILAEVANSHALIVYSVNNQFKSFSEGLLTRYGLIPSKDNIESEQPIERVVEEAPSAAEEISTEQIIEETPTEAVDKVIEEPEKEPIESEKHEENQDMLPKDMTNRLKEIKWYETKGRDYLIHSVDTLEPDIKLFWINILADKKESEILTYEDYGYQIVVGKGNILWIRRWTKEQLKKQPETPKQETT